MSIRKINKEILKNFLIFLFLTSFFSSFLLFLNREKIFFNELVFEDQSDKTDKNVDFFEEVKDEKIDYFLIIVIIIAILLILLSAKVVWKICFSKKKFVKDFEENFYKDEIKDKKIEIKRKNSDSNINFKGKKEERAKNILDMEENLKEINTSDFKTDNINTYEFQNKNKKYINFYSFNLNDHKINITPFDEKNPYNRKLIEKKSCDSSQKIFYFLIRYYGIDDGSIDSFYDSLANAQKSLFTTEKKILAEMKNGEKNDVNFYGAHNKNSFISKFFAKREIMTYNEGEKKITDKEAKKMGGFVNYYGEKKFNIATKGKSASKFIDHSGKDNGKKDLEYLHSDILKFILSEMIDDQSIVTNELVKDFDNFLNFNSEGILKKFLFKFKNDEEKEYRKKIKKNELFTSLIEKGAYFLIFALADFHNMSLKVISGIFKNEDNGSQSPYFVSKQKNIRSRFQKAAGKINYLYEKFVKVEEKIKKRKEKIE